MGMQKISLYSLIVMIAFSSCRNGTENASAKLVDPLASHIDSTVSPGNDFFNYCNGGWLKKNPIPASESGWGIFGLVHEENLMRIRKISEEATAANATKGSATQQIGDFFSAGMDSARIEKEDFQPIKPLLDEVDAIADIPTLMKVMFHLNQMGVGVGFSMDISADMKNSEKNFLSIYQGGLGLSNRDYYFKTDSQTTAIRKEYPNHISRMLTMVYSNAEQAKQQAEKLVALETSLAASHKTLAELRDPYANYHKMTMKDVDALIPHAQIITNFELIGIHTDSAIVGQPAFLKTLNNLLTMSKLEDWKSYLRFHVISSFSNYLSSRFVQEDFNFFEKLRTGTKEQKPRWKRVLGAQEYALGDALGQLYVKEYFPEKTKKRYDDLVEQVVISYREHIQKLDWMSDSTKQKAIQKLNSITRKIGYPQKWKDYSSMNITRDSYCKNIMEANKWHFQFEVNKLGKPVDRSEWGMTPQTYNAYYNPSNNEIVLPAAIFTAPGYKDEDLDDALVYGYVGASTIGHELTHGFDDEGRQFDAHGNLNNWWSKDDEQKFNVKAQAIVDQFNAFTLLKDKHPNGKACLGENIADLGGIVIALDAFKKTKQFKENKMIAGLTPLQRYFMGYAYGWMEVRTDQKVADGLLTDVHAPIFLRVIGPMSNCNDWYTAFNVKPGDKNYKAPENRTIIW